jgi:glyoxylase-like metal-dependent hydrolase (beta-lactamase superfamily II)
MDDLAQLPAAYRHRVGEIVVTTIHDGHNRMPLQEGFVRDVSLAQMQAALAAAHLPTDALPITFTPMLVQTGGETVLIDTGYGAKGPATAGKTLDNLAAAGVAPTQVTKVLISHFHGDHINGLLDAEGRPAFPNASVCVPQAEWDFWTGGAARETLPERAQANVANVERVFNPIREAVVPFTWDSPVAEGITALGAPGHTPGMTIFDIASGGDRLLYIADVVNHPALFVRNPDWAAVFDMEPEQAKQTRHRVLGMLADTGTACAGFHVPFPAIGYIERDGEGFRHVPAQWMAAV